MKPTIIGTSGHAAIAARSAFDANQQSSRMLPCPVLVDVNEMSRRISIAKGTLYNWVYLKRIPFVKCGRCLRFDPDEVIRSLPRSTTMDLADRR